MISAEAVLVVLIVASFAALLALMREAARTPALGDLAFEEEMWRRIDEEAAAEIPPAHLDPECVYGWDHDRAREVVHCIGCGVSYHADPETLERARLENLAGYYLRTLAREGGKKLEEERSV